MIVHIFQSGSAPYYGFTADRAGASLPPSDRGAWRHVGSEDMNRGEARVGLSAAGVAAVLAGIDRDGFYTLEGKSSAGQG